MSSRQIGLSKPTLASTAQHSNGSLWPDAVMFFDDVAENVAAASTLGIRAFQVDGVEGLRERLRREGIL